MNVPWIQNQINIYSIIAYKKLNIAFNIGFYRIRNLKFETNQDYTFLKHLIH